MALSRRDFLSQLPLTGVGAVWLAAAVSCAKDAEQATEPPALPHDAGAPARVLKVLTPEQFQVVEAITARIIPSGDSPGAREAGVVWFIDWALSDVAADQRPVFDAGLATLAADVAAAHPGAASFAALTDAQQDALLRARESTPFFETMRFSTIAGMFALPKYGGNAEYIGWALVGQEHVWEHRPPFGWYDRPENQQALLGRVL